MRQVRAEAAVLRGDRLPVLWVHSDHPGQRKQPQGIVQRHIRDCHRRQQACGGRFDPLTSGEFRLFGRECFGDIRTVATVLRPHHAPSCGIHAEFALIDDRE